MLKFKKRFKCRKGHLLNDKNSRLATRTDNRSPYWVCKVCKNERQRFRYRHDESFRLKELTRKRVIAKTLRDKREQANVLPNN